MKQATKPEALKDAPRIEALRRAFQAVHPDPDLLRPRPAECPAPEAIWDAATGAANAAERVGVIDHLAACAYCTLAWRMATDLKDEGENAYDAAFDDTAPRATDIAPVVPITTSRQYRPPASWRRVLLPLISAAAVVSMVVGWLFFQQGHRNPEIHATRGGAPTVEAPASPEDGATLPREDFVLEWTPGPAGTTYDVWLLGDGFKLLAEFENLTEPRVKVPEGELAGVDPGTEVDWRVEKHLPSGDVRSEAYSSVVE